MDETRIRWKDEWRSKADRSPNPFARRAWEFLEGTPAGTLLDVGCGDGRDSLFFAERGLRVTAVDFSESGLAVLREADPRIQAVLQDIRKLDFPDASFDAVYAHLSLHYFDDAVTEAIFRNIHRMLRGGGLFFVKCKSLADPLFGKGEKVGENMYRTDHVRHFFSPEYLREKLRDFAVVDLQETTASYDGTTSAFIEAVARREVTRNA